MDVCKSAVVPRYMCTQCSMRIKSNLTNTQCHFSVGAKVNTSLENKTGTTHVSTGSCLQLVRCSKLIVKAVTWISI
jgi:hypothetical protein